MKILTFRLVLLPFAWAFDVATRLRNALFDAGVLRQRAFPLPVIAVGNLSVGGTGKTPHTEYLLRLLSEGRRVAMVSRGYGRTTRGFRLASAGDTAGEIGDEPWQMWRKFPQAVVAVDGDRCEALDRLLADGQLRPDVAVLDDAFQHRHVRAGLYVLLTECGRLYSDDWLMPAGRLRESARGARRADIVIVSKCPHSLTSSQAADVRARLRLRAGQSLFFTATAYGAPYPLFRGEALPVMSAPLRVLVVTGIARPRPLLDYVARDGVAVTSLAFPDHHAFNARDVRRINDAFARLPFGSVAVTTEKDAARLFPLREELSPALRRSLYVQPVETIFLNPRSDGLASAEKTGATAQECFNQIISDYVARDTRNRPVD